jgi:2-haloacid dehalogenase
MFLDRRTFLALGAAGVLTNAHSQLQVKADWHKIRVIAFDAFAVFETRPVLEACEEAFPGRGAELGSLWGARQFEYQWLRALGGQYKDFWQATHGALEFATRSLHLELSKRKSDSLMASYLALKTWPEVPGALAALRASGRKLILLSNATGTILNANIQNSGLEGNFHHVASTHSIRTYKPDPRAYQLGLDVTGVEKQETMFVASAGWDAAGAKWFGYPTFWINRKHTTAEVLGATPDGSGESMSDLVRFLTAQ